MLQSPKSLTATIHVRFHYGELEAKPVSQSETELLNRILDQASLMDPSLQECLVNFVNYLNKLSGEGAEPGGDKH